MRGGLLELAGGQLKGMMKTMVFKILGFDLFLNEKFLVKILSPSALPVKQQTHLSFPDEGCFAAKNLEIPCSLAKTSVLFRNFALPRRKHCEIQNHDLMEDVSFVTLQPI